MSPSEVIIEVYIMPEDAALVLFLSFSLKTFTFITGGGGKEVSSSPPTSVTAGLAPPCSSH